MSYGRFKTGKTLIYEYWIVNEVKFGILPLSKTSQFKFLDLQS